jgi:hypothetical protein
MAEKKSLIGVLLFSLVLIVSGMISPGLANGSISTDTVVVDFGDVVQGSSKTITLQITNLTDHLMTLWMTFSSDVSCSFLLTGSSVVYMPGHETVDVGVTYEALSTGPCEGSLYIYYSGSPSGTETVTLLGNGVEEIEPNSFTIVIDGCDTGVTDREDEGTGSRISALIAECENDPKNHGDYVRCIANVTNQLIQAGTISGEDKGAIQSCAAQAKLP